MSQWRDRLGGDRFDRDRLRRVVERSTQVVIMAGLVGAITGFGVAAFERIVVGRLLNHINDLPLWMVALAPTCGLLLALGALTFIGGGISPATSDEYLKSFHDPAVHLSLRGLAARIAASIATLGFGGAMGLEGPSLYLGATIGAQSQHRLPSLFRGADRRLLMVAGAAAGVAAIFKAPATGAIFAIEVPYQDELARRMLLPALVSAATGYLAFVAINGTERIFPIAGEPTFNFRDLLGALGTRSRSGVGGEALRRDGPSSEGDHDAAHHPPTADRRRLPRGDLRRDTDRDRREPHLRAGVQHDHLGARSPSRHLARASGPGLTVRGHNSDRRGRGCRRPLHPPRGRGRVVGTLRRRRGAESRLQPVRRDRRGRVPRRGLPSAARGRHVRGRDHRPAWLRRARPARGSCGRAHDGPQLDHEIPGD